jgi:cell division protease FtsH
LIEQEVKDLIEEGYQTARKILEEKQEDYERLAKGLLEYETLTGDEIKKVIAGIPLGQDDDAAPPPSGSLPSVTSIPKTKPATPKGGETAPEPSA